MAEPKTKVPAVPKRGVMSNKATSTNTSGAVRGKTAQADGHKADVNRLANAIPKK
jgi:hypothetical protein